MCRTQNEIITLNVKSANSERVGQCRSPCKAKPSFLTDGLGLEPGKERAKLEPSPGWHCSKLSSPGEERPFPGAASWPARMATTRLQPGARPAPALPAQPTRRAHGSALLMRHPVPAASPRRAAPTAGTEGWAGGGHRWEHKAISSAVAAVAFPHPRASREGRAGGHPPQRLTGVSRGPSAELQQRRAGSPLPAPLTPTSGSGAFWGRKWLLSVFVDSC